MQYRTFNGSFENLPESTINVTDTPFLRIAPAYYADDQRGLVSGPNPREISNIVVGEGNALEENPQGLSGMMYAWGQFIDHDINLTADARTGARIDITIPDDDMRLLPGSTIPMSRAATDAAGQPVNAVTGWIDASMVYGSTIQLTERLRTPDGHMQTSEGNNLPLAPIDPTGENTQTNEGGLPGHLAGDGRADENPSLTALQTLFVREHNWQVDRLHEADPTMTGNELFDQARAIVTAEIEHITYSEFLPHLLGSLAPSEYAGYDASVDPRMAIEFAGAAYRFGHSIVSPRTEKLDEFGHSAGEILLRDTFFLTPDEFAADGGADGLLRHLAADKSQALDVRIVDDLRNFLFDPPVGIDLAAINVQRGRDLGLPTLNGMREALHLDRYTDFAQITDDHGTVDALRQVYDSVDAVDLWTGGLAERTLPGAFIGETFGQIIADQFERSRDGDPLWFQNQGFDATTLDEINHTSLADIILRNTDTQHLQEDVFVFYERRTADAEAQDPDSPQLIITAEDTVLT